MNRGSQCLKVFFEAPFWVGIIERQTDEMLEVCKITFVSEPKEVEILALIPQLKELVFSPAVSITVKERAKNYKRRLKESRRESRDLSAGTRSQQALKLKQQQEQAERKTAKHTAKDEKKQMDRVKRCNKRLKKRKGR